MNPAQDDDGFETRSREFCLDVSITDVIRWANPLDDDRPAGPNLHLQAVCDAIGIAPDWIRHYDDYLDGPRESGHIHIHRSRLANGDLLVLDAFRDLYDQQDMIVIAVRCKSGPRKTVRDGLRRFFDGAREQAGYEERWFSERLARLLGTPELPGDPSTDGVRRIRTYHEYD
ncbi:hypothetical protein [Lysobacter capsici]|jgi:hypothetical protein|uniref:hypothetical protein n=1 Tax=Lysobacter capsici TaxID=435897 RepID=UPI000BBB594B|nr:hypothetical protein [Lysobacter capsici]ATE70740.1 hypothetical protein CNO08_04815 [Lysobacter capsici]QWF18124.1 hypothetical protein KME82_04965 [Lysobacter capsici]